MKTLELYQVDAFASELFRGNPAAVCILEAWLPDATMQSIAAENNLAETAFAIPSDGGYSIRWFTPETEVALCGHATLATAFVLFNGPESGSESIHFETRERGPLEVSRSGDWLVLDFPADPLEAAEMQKGLTEALEAVPSSCWKGLTDYMLVFDTEQQIRQLRPNYFLMDQIPARGTKGTKSEEPLDHRGGGP